MVLTAWEYDLRVIMKFGQKTNNRVKKQIPAETPGESLLAGQPLSQDLTSSLLGTLPVDLMLPSTETAGVDIMPAAAIS